MKKSLLLFFSLAATCNYSMQAMEKLQAELEFKSLNYKFETIKKENLLLDEILEQLPSKDAIQKYPEALKKNNTHWLKVYKFLKKYPKFSESSRLKKAYNQYRNFARFLPKSTTSKFELERYAIGNKLITSQELADLNQAFRTIKKSDNLAIKNEKASFLIDVAYKVSAFTAKYPELELEHKEKLNHLATCWKKIAQPHLLN